MVGCGYLWLVVVGNDWLGVVEWPSTKIYGCKHVIMGRKVILQEKGFLQGRNNQSESLFKSLQMEVIHDVNTNGLIAHLV